MKSQQPSAPPPFTLLALAAAATLALPAAAQTAAPAAAGDKAEKKVEAITVTGSRIRGIEPIGSPVVGVGRADIESSNVASTALLLQQVPQVFNLGVSENSRGQSGGSGNITYSSAINLRGIGPFATLVLVNGHRVVGQGTTAAAVDPSIIPMLMLERVEIVPDGASAIYGSDAVAGVANLIMRRNEKTVQAFARLGRADSYAERQLGALWATRWASGQATIGFEHSYRDALSGRDRDFFTADLRSQGGGDFRSTQCAPGNIVISGTNYAIPAGGVTSANAASLVAGTSNKCDNLKVQDLIPRQERNGLGFTFNQDLEGGILVYADGFATERRYRFRPGALASNLTVPSTNPFYVRPPTAPAGASETVAYSFINDLPVNTANGFSRTYQVTAGVDKTLGKDWRVGALLGVGYNDDLSVTQGALTAGAITAALADTNPATSLNVFGGTNNPATLAKLAQNQSYSPGTTNFHNLQFKADGPLFALPGGDVRAATGLEFQNLRLIGGQIGGTPAAPTIGMVKLERRVQSAYLELAVPLVGEKNALPGVQKLDLTAAARHDKYSDVGATTNPKVGLTWQPVQGLQVRGSYGESFRAPGLTQIRGFTNGGRGGLFVQNYSDPTNGGALRVGVTLSAGNPDLKPETAKTKTFGFDWEPAKGTKFSLSWFDIDYENQITGYLSDLTILNREAAFAGTNIIQRNPSAALVQQLIATYPLSSGVLPQTWTLFVDGRNFNLGRSVSKGVDFAASTKINTEHWGQIGLGISGTRFSKYDVALTPASAPVSQLNQIYNPMKFKARVNANWSYGATYTSLTLNHTNAYDNVLANPVQKVKANNTWDLRVALALEEFAHGAFFKDATLSLGVQNLTDQKPPFVNVAQSNNGGGGFDPTQTNPVGRLFSLSLDKRF